MRTGDPSDPSSISGSLSVFAGGKIDLPELNDIAVSVSGSASGSDTDFVFNNISPLKLQNVSGVFASRNVIIRTPRPVPVSGTDTGPVANALLNDINRAADPGENLNKSADERKDEADKREREEQKKRGTQSCS